MRIENWRWLYKVQNLLITGLVMLVADALISGMFLAFGVAAERGFSVVAGIMALLGTLPFLWTARPHGVRHLLILCGAVFAATAVSLVTLALVTNGLITETMNHEYDRGLLFVPVIPVLVMWGLIYWLAPRGVIWEVPPDEDVAD